MGSMRTRVVAAGLAMALSGSALIILGVFAIPYGSLVVLLGSLFLTTGVLLPAAIPGSLPSSGWAGGGPRAQPMAFGRPYPEAVPMTGGMLQALGSAGRTWLSSGPETVQWCIRCGAPVGPELRLCNSCAARFA